MTHVAGAGRLVKKMHLKQDTINLKTDCAMYGIGDGIMIVDLHL